MLLLHRGLLAVDGFTDADGLRGDRGAEFRNPPNTQADKTILPVCKAWAEMDSQACLSLSGPDPRSLICSSQTTADSGGHKAPRSSGTRR